MLSHSVSMCLPGWWELLHGATRRALQLVSVKITSAMNRGVELPASKRALIEPGIWDERRRGETTCSTALPYSNSYCGTVVGLSANWKPKVRIGHQYDFGRQWRHCTGTQAVNILWLLGHVKKKTKQQKNPHKKANAPLSGSRFDSSSARREKEISIISLRYVINIHYLNALF